MAGHGRRVNVDKRSTSAGSTSYIVEYADGYREGIVKVYKPETMTELIRMLVGAGVDYTSELLRSPPESRGVRGYLVKFNFDDLTGDTIVLDIPRVGELE